MPQPLGRRTLLALCALAGAVLAGPAAAQCYVPPGQQRTQPCTDTAAPKLQISPAGGGTSTREWTVVAKWTDESYTPRPTVTLNGADVSSHFSFATTTGPIVDVDVGVHGTSRGTFQLADGSNTVVVRVCDDRGQCTSASTTYTFAASHPIPPRNAQTLLPPSGQAHTFREVAAAAYRQMLQRDATEAEIAHWGDLLARMDGGYHVKYMVRALAFSPEFRDRYITGHDERSVVTHLYQRILGREPDPAAGNHYVQLARTAGWDPVMNHLFDSGEYNQLYAAHSVPAPWQHVRYWDPGRAPLVLDPANLTHVRDACLTTPTGPSTAQSCGDLTMSYALPALTFEGETHQFVLSYNNQHAHPTPVVGAWIIPSPTGGSPSSVSAVLRVELPGGAVEKARWSWTGSDWAQGQARRIAMTFDALDLPTGSYGIVVEATVAYPGGQTASYVTRGALPIVNRSRTPYGAGWWPAGVDQLIHVDAYKILRVTSSGSIRAMYAAFRTPNTWIDHSFNRADTLRHDPATGTYWRQLPDRTRIVYRGGLQTAVYDRVGREMRFEYGSTARGTALTQVWRWGPGRVVAALGYNASGRLTSASGWAGGPHETVHFDPDNGDDRINRIYNTATGDMVFLTYGGNAWVRSERGGSPAGAYGTTTHYEYSSAGRLSIAWVDMQGASSNLATRFTHQQALGLAQPIAAADVYTSIDGPRNDAADIVRTRLDAWGASAVTRDPFNAEERITRAHVHFPGLVTQAVGTDGVVRRGWFDARGRLDSARVENPLNDGRNAVTRVLGYHADLHHFPTRTMGPDGVVTEVGYDANGSVLWSQTGPDAARRVRYEYVPSGRAVGQLSAVHVPLPGGRAATTTFGYDTVGNRRWTRDPRGLLSLTLTDSWGRVTGTVTPIDSALATTEASLLASGLHTAVTYGARGQDSLTFTYGPARRIPWVFGTNVVQTTVPAEGVAVEKLYDAAGNLAEVTRWSATDPGYDRPAMHEAGIMRSSYRYDVVGRLVERKEGDDNPTVYRYDLAGNPVEITNGNGHTVRGTYDALGRLVQSRTPAVSHARACAPHVPESYAFAHDKCDDPRNHFPFFPNDVSNAYVVWEDVSTYWYDGAGRLVGADNGAARVRRAYYRGGLLASDSVQIGGVSASDPTTTYGVEYGYDIAGRPLWVGHPSNLASGQMRDQVAYDSDYGHVTQLLSRSGVAFSFRYDAVGRLASRTSPAGRDTLEYDHIGQLVRRTTPVFNEGIRRDARGKSVEVLDGDRRFYNHFSALGSLVGTEWQRGITGRLETEEFRTNTVGQTLWRRSRGANPSYPSYHPEDDLKHEGISGRLRYSEARKPADYPIAGGDPRFESQRLFYDRAGNTTWSRYLRQGMDGYKRVDRAYYHGADDRLMAVQTLEDYDMFFTGERRGSFEEFRYDALGRRVLKRTRRGQPLCKSSSTAVDCSNVVERFVWSGDNLLWETRSDDDNPAAGTLGGEHLGAVGYTHGSGTDQPLVVWKGGSVVIPHATWRGSFGMGTNVSGSAAASIQWPAYTSTAWHRQPPPPNKLWFGSLIGGSRDVSGLLYRRARYYDPQSGQFTQQDPMGVAGGLNTYGFANGDPVSNRDPFGLAAEEISRDGCVLFGLICSLDRVVVVGTPGCSVTCSVNSWFDGLLRRDTRDDQDDAMDLFVAGTAREAAAQTDRVEQIARGYIEPGSDCTATGIVGYTLVKAGESMGLSAARGATGGYTEGLTHKEVLGQARGLAVRPGGVAAVARAGVGAVRGFALGALSNLVQEEARCVNKVFF